MTRPARWDPPAGAVAELIRATATQLLEQPQSLFDELDAAVLETTVAGVLTDPALVAAVGRTSRANLMHWATANVERPGARVAPNIGPDTLDFARDIVRRGLDDTSLNGYRVGQNIAWRRWMDTAFSLSSDPSELRAMLDVSSRSMSAFVDETLSGIGEQLDREREQLQSQARAERLEVVSLILEGAPITTERASGRLRYELSRRHTACILWSDAGAPAHGELERTANALAERAGAQRPFTVAASAGSLWAWFGTDHDPEIDPMAELVTADSGIRVAIGSTLAGIDGFRRSHLDAQVAQRLMHRGPSSVRFASHQEVQLVAIATHDEEAAAAFVARTLGDLATADHDLRETLRAYIREEFNATRCARVQFAHRNTILNRLARAEALLPAPLDGRGLEVGLALEIVQWLDARP